MGAERTLRAGVYLRVSSRDQSHDSQRQALADYVARRGWTVAGTFTDTVVGTARVRPGLTALNEAARKREIDVVVVFRFDRFARSVSHLVGALEEYRALGVDFVSVNDPVDTTTPAGRAMFTIIGAFAELERSILSERVTAGMDAARKRGVKVGRPQGVTPEAAAEAIRVHGGVRAAGRALKVSPTTIQRALARRPETVVGEPPESAVSSVPDPPPSVRPES